MIYSYKYSFVCHMSNCNDYMPVYYYLLTGIVNKNTRAEYAWERAYEYFKKYAHERGFEINTIKLEREETI